MKSTPDALVQPALVGVFHFASCQARMLWLSRGSRPQQAQDTCASIASTTVVRAEWTGWRQFKHLAFLT
ncbi:hypothetical protein T11_12590 [Trichinella zimbabwensis]|uniref:Uncharacterized protein n=1 Tax=Trichinella zimbabwensis TaxID=268475 RepID=A0A0V1H2D9_9BILA|nr:hypothetical protein T11_12590 [Trichinella zimbabwensis]